MGHTLRWRHIRGVLWHGLNWIFICTLLGGVFFFAFVSFQYRFQWERIWEYRQIFFEGFLNTVIVAVFSLILSLCLGSVIGILRSSGLVCFRIASSIYIESIRNTPLLVQILLFFYVVANAVGFENRYIAGIFIMSFFSGAYVAEIVRAGVESIEDSQIESANSLGFTKLQIYQFVVFPQVLQRIIPPLTGQLVSLIKDSSLLSIISVREFTLAAREVSSVTYTNLESYFVLAVGYLALTFPISLFARHLEKRFSIRAAS